MKETNQKNLAYLFKRKTLKYVSAFLLFVFLISVYSHQFSFLSEGFLLNTFETSSEKVASTFFSETRATSTGDVIRRVETGLEELPYVDFLLVKDMQGKTQSILMNNETRLLKSKELPNNFLQVFGSQGGNTLKIFLIFSITITLFVLRILKKSLYNAQTKQLLISHALSRIRSINTNYLSYKKISY